MKFICWVAAAACFVWFIVANGFKMVPALFLGFILSIAPEIIQAYRSVKEDEKK